MQGLITRNAAAQSTSSSGMGRRNLTVLALGLALSLAAASVGIASAADEPVQLRYWVPNDIGYEGEWLAVFDEWNQANPDVQVAFEMIPFDEYTGAKLTTAFASGTGPDLFVMSPGSFLDYVSNGVAAPLDDIMADYLDDFLPDPLEAATVDGHIYGIPYEMEPVGLFYRKDILAEAGVEPPTTWEELRDAARQLTTDEHYGLQIETAPGIYQNFTWYPFLWSTGADVVDAEWDSSGMRSEEAAAALELWADLISDGSAPSYNAAPTYDHGYLCRGEVAMQVNGIWALGAMRADCPEVDYGIVPLPSAPDGTPVSVYGGWKQIVNAHSPHLEEAKRFARWLRLDNEAFQKDWACGFRTEISPRKSVTEACLTEWAEDPHALTMVNELAPIARSEPRYPSGIVQPVSDAIQAVMFGSKSGLEAGAEAADAIEAFLADYTGSR